MIINFILSIIVSNALCVFPFDPLTRENIMKKILIILFVALLSIPNGAQAQLLESIKKIFQRTTGLTQADAANGIKEALVKGTANGVNLVSKADGYFGSPEIKIPFPADAAAMQTKLRAMGLGKQVDNVILTINRAAEDAAKDAQPIFIDAIKKMTITDAIAIVKGDTSAATSYLKKTTDSSLNQKFQPSIRTSLEKVNATKYWAEITATYNRLPFVRKINPDLSKYVTGKAIDGLFLMIAKEEGAIRNDPRARTTELLKKVFGK